MIVGIDRLKKLFGDKYDSKQYQPNGIDLKLKGVESFSENNKVIGIINDEKFLPNMNVVVPTDKKYVFKKNTPYVINLGEHHIPNGFVGLFYIRSTFMRMGCLLSSSVADMGYSGTLKMLFYNPLQDVTVEQNERIVQMVLYDAEDNANYDGSYQENNWIIDDDILVSIADDGLPITIFGKCYMHEGYLYCNNKGLHLHIYEFYNGNIDKKFEIHHINHNKLDNRIANLKKLTINEHRSHHNKGVSNPSTKNKISKLPFGFSVKTKYENGDYLGFQYFDNNGVRRWVSSNRIDELVDKSIDILESLDKDYSDEIKSIKDWAEINDLDVISFKRLEKNNLPKGCRIHKKKSGNPVYEFYHPSPNFLGSSVDFDIALKKAIENTDDELYKSYLIKRWLK